MVVYLFCSSVIVFLCCYCFAHAGADSDSVPDCGDDEDFLMVNRSIVADAFAFDRLGGPQLFDVGERIVEMFD